MTQGIELGNVLPGYYARIGGVEVEVVRRPDTPEETMLVFGNTGVEVPSLDSILGFGDAGIQAAQL